MRVVIGGATGLIGSALQAALTAAGHEPVPLRRGDGPGTWDPAAGRLDAALLAGADAVVNLAGESVAGGRWTAERRRRILDSRVDSTRLLVERMAALPEPPKVFACASAVGYYGDRGDEELTETSPAGSGFLAEVCQAWEAAAQPAAQTGLRVANLRLGVVLSVQGGALATMLTPFRLGLGGRIGSGRQWLSWITLDDAVSAIVTALEHESLAGPVNLVTPNPVRNAEFVATLAAVLGRPAWLPVPAFALRAVLGELAEETLLAGQRVLPRRLLDAGFPYAWPELRGALQAVLGRA